MALVSPNEINAMGHVLRPSTLVARGFVVETIVGDGVATLIRVRPPSSGSVCPGCGTRSERIHSRDQRRLADLPLAGKPVRLVVAVRRFSGDSAPCGRRIFAERFDEGIVARDRGGGYAVAAAKALPKATQVADRWLLMETASRAFLDAVRQSMRQIRRVLGAATINPDRLTAAERLQHEGYLRRQETNPVRLRLAKDGARNGTELSRLPSRRNRMDDTPPAIGKDHWRHLKPSALSRVPSSRTFARLMPFGRDTLCKSETVTVAAIETGVPPLVETREIIATVQHMIRKKSLAAFEPWLKRARSSPVASFANGIANDQAAVRAAIVSPWSNGQTEGPITKLKLVKRQMSGRGEIDLLQARVIGAQSAPLPPKLRQSPFRTPIRMLASKWQRAPPSVPDHFCKCDSPGRRRLPAL